MTELLGICCPRCKGDTLVVDSRPVVHGTRRRHKCLSCGFRFSTMETLIPSRKSPYGN